VIKLLLDREASVKAQLADEYDISAIDSNEIHTEIMDILLDPGHNDEGTALAQKLHAAYGHRNCQT